MNGTYGGFLKWGYPNLWRVLNGTSDLEMDDNWWYPQFREAYLYGIILLNVPSRSRLDRVTGMVMKNFC